MFDQDARNTIEAGSGRRGRLYRVEGIVLRRMDTGEADRIVTLFTREYGKRRFIAKGSRRPSSRIAGHLEPFTRVRMLVAKTRGLHIISQAETIDSFGPLRTSETSIATAGLLTELTDSLTPEDQQQETVFDLLASSLRLLEQGNEQVRIALIAQWLLLGELGYRPELYACIHCRRDIEPVVNGFSFDGGIVCDRCLGSVYDAQRVSVNALKLMRAIDRGDIDRVLRIRIGPDVLRELDTLVAGYVNAIVGRESRARRVLSDLRLEYQYEEKEHRN